eukprot:TRINITY_DN48967_c0_g1_i1.p1 TRINITY_DN48967_c0_g1~~TRINITY_DN48967_c0_g1_i1.p1  ORF type:complete len:406 (-),score=67.75 TRINITY_DN48967_c0_g1_i1:57-1274(-)
MSKARSALDLAKAESTDHASLLLTSLGGNKACEKGPLSPTVWPSNYTPIKRVKFKDIDQLLEILKPQSQDGVPLIVEGTDILDVEKWQDLDYVKGLLQDSQTLVKRSPSTKFRYFDAKKNTGKFDFSPPLEELRHTFPEFLAMSDEILTEGREQRLYLQETLSGHEEMADEFANWKWELLVGVSNACGWGLPDSNELFVGMVGAETPLHFDERENLFLHVRGQKEVCVFPFVDYCRLYPFPTTHPCDRQSMVGNPRAADLEAFPKFADAVGQYAVLKAGDLLYLPYGWWHWLRNLENHALSISFWSTTPNNDLSKGVPSTFSENMLTRVRRNLESMIAEGGNGCQDLPKNMLQVREAILSQNEKDPLLCQVRALLTAVRLKKEQQDKFMLELIEGRFDVDWNKHV